MAFYKLLAGKHYGPDMSKPADDKGRRPSKKYSPGDVVESELDLEEFGGPNKFKKVDAPRSRKQSLGSAPELARGGSGQVVSGLQKASSAEDGTPGGEYVPVTDPEEQLPAMAEGELSGRRSPPSGREKDGRMLDETGGEVEEGDDSGTSGGQTWDDFTSNYGQLEDMTLQDMKDAAQMEEINVTGCHKKDEYARKIKAHYGR